MFARFEGKVAYFGIMALGLGLAFVDLSVVETLTLGIGGALLLLLLLLRDRILGRRREARLERALATLRAERHALSQAFAGAKELFAQTPRLETSQGDAARQGDGQEEDLQLLRPLMRRFVAPAAPPEPAGTAEATAAEVGPRRPAVPASDIDEGVLMDLVAEALRDGRVDLMLQPIVTLPQRQRLFYEVFSRLRGVEGLQLEPTDYLPLAERDGQIAALDSLLLLRCLQVLRRVQRRQPAVAFFCNLSAHAMADAEVFGNLADYLASKPELCTSLGFELAAVDLPSHSAEARRLFERLRAAGARFSLDRARVADLDLATVVKRGIDFVKLEAAELAWLQWAGGDTGVGTDRGAGGGGSAGLRKRLGDLRAAGITLVFAKVEDEAILRDLLDLPIEPGQGFLFGAPRLAR